MKAFEITGLGFIGTLLAVTVVVFLLAVFLPPRMRRTGWLRYLVQAVSLVLVATLALASVAALLNRDNNWYTSWDELTAGPAPAATTTHYGAVPAAVTTPATVRQTPTELQSHPEDNPQFGHLLDRDAEDGQYLTFHFKGPVTGQANDLMIWLPASYLSHPDRFYPVILGFTGFPGSPATYSRSVDYGQMIADAAQNRSMREAIFVVPNVSPGSYDSECVDGDRPVHGMGTPKAESYVTRDVVPWLRQNLRTIDDPRAWSTEGYSAGGWCSAMLTLRHPDLFGTAMIQSGYFSPIYTGAQQWTEARDPKYDLARIARDEAPDVALYYYSSTDDTLSWPAAEAFRRSVRAPTSLSVNTVPVGGHRLDVWLPGMEQGLQWLGRTSPYFAPTAT